MMQVLNTYFFNTSMKTEIDLDGEIGSYLLILINDL